MTLIAAHIIPNTHFNFWPKYSARQPSHLRMHNSAAARASQTPPLRLFPCSGSYGRLIATHGITSRQSRSPVANSCCQPAAVAGGSAPRRTTTDCWSLESELWSCGDRRACRQAAQQPAARPRARDAAAVA